MIRTCPKCGKTGDSGMGTHIRFCTVDQLAKFMSKVVKAESGCWLWQGAKNQYGYGLATYEGKKNQTAHRLSYRIHKGEIQPGLLALHTCDTPACVNPEHLFLGSNKDNMDDCRAKGRVGRTGAKFTPEDVIAIRAAKAEGKTLKEVAAQFDTTYLTVWVICQRRTWKNVP